MLRRLSERSGHRAAIYDLAPAPFSFYSVAADGFLVHWHRQDVDFGRVVASVESGKFMCLEHPLPDLLVAGSLDGGLHWLYPESPERNRHIAHHGRGTFCLLAVGNDLYSGGGDGVLTRWSVDEGCSLESLPLSANSLRSLAYDPAKDQLAVGASDGRIYLIDRQSWQITDRAEAHPPSVFAAAFMGDKLITGGRDARLTLWNCDNGLQPIKSVTAHLMTVNEIAVHPKKQLVATASRDKTVKLWHGNDLSLLKVVEVVRDKGHVNSVNTLAWLDEDTLITAGDDRRILEWELYSA